MNYCSVVNFPSRPDLILCPPPQPDEIDCTIVEATRLALLAVEVLKDARNRPTEYPRPSTRAATLLRCAAEILADLSR
jgi:hypothetical protein